jgi:hypothetical protein
VVLTGTADLKRAVDRHLTSLVDNAKNFKFFPLYKSPLEVLKHVYEYYSQLGEDGEDVSGISSRADVIDTDGATETSKVPPRASLQAS